MLQPKSAQRAGTVWKRWTDEAAKAQVRKPAREWSHSVDALGSDS